MSLQKNEKLFFPVTKIYYALASEISSMEYLHNGTINVNFNIGKDWKLLYASLNSISFAEPMKRVDEGIIYNQSIELKNPGDDLDNNIVIEDLVKQNLLFKLNFINKESKILGDTDNPAILDSNFKSGDLSTLRSIKITRKSSFPAPYLYSY